MANPIPQGGVALVASNSGTTYTAASDNPALRLAEALAPVERSLGGTLDRFAKQKQASAAAAAKADALSNSGEAFKEAVKSGKLKPTSSPWYISAYEEDAAAIRAQGQTAQLISDSQSWAERNDPQAFAARLAKEAGAQAQTFQGVEQSAGYNSSAAPLLQQALASNNAYNAQRIQQENVQQVTTLATQSVIDVRRQNPKASPQDYFNALKASKEKWLAVGNTEASWNDVAVGAIAGAAYSAGDSSILNILKTGDGNSPPLYNITDKSGNPNAEQIEQYRYRIDQAVANQGMADTRAAKNKVVQEGMGAYQEVWDTYGFGFIEGAVSKAELVQHLKDKGFSPQATQYALGQFAEDAGKNTALTRALMGADEEVLALSAEATSKGRSPALDAKLSTMVRQGRITLDEAQQIQGQGQARNNHLESLGNATANRAESDRRADIRETRTLTIQQAADLKRRREQLTASTLGTMKTAAKGITAKLEVATANAENAWLYSHPDDFEGAHNAAKNAANVIANEYLQSRLKSGGQGAPSGAQSASGNSRR